MRKPFDRLPPRGKKSAALHHSRVQRWSSDCGRLGATRGESLTRKPNPSPARSAWWITRSIASAAARAGAARSRTDGADAPRSRRTTDRSWMPEQHYRARIFRAEEGGDQAAKMVEAVAAYALPFMRRLTELSEVCGELDRGSDTSTRSCTVVLWRGSLRRLKGLCVPGRLVLLVCPWG